MEDSIVFKPQACPLARSASVQLIGCHLLDGEVRGPEEVCARVGGEGDVVEPPRACTVLNDHPVAVTTSGDATVRLWDLREHRELDRIDLPTSVRAIGVGARGTRSSPASGGTSWSWNQRQDDVALSRIQLLWHRFWPSPGSGEDDRSEHEREPELLGRVPVRSSAPSSQAGSA